MAPEDADDGQDMIPLGFSISPDQRDDLDDIKRRWDRREARSVNRSEVAREALAIGVVALDLFDEKYTEPTTAITTRDREAIVRQALLDFFRESED